MVWGESNSRDFLDWADFCRNNTIKEKLINSSTNGANFAVDKSSPQYNSFKTTILNTIENYRSISVQQLYNVLPEVIVANPTSKHIILQLYFEDNLKIQGQVKNNNDRESNFVLIFVKKIKTKQPAPLTSKQKGQSNIEDLIDNNWQATGRKLEFEKIKHEDKSNLNISLKRVNPTLTNKVGEKPNIDVRKTIKEKPVYASISKTAKKEEILVKVNSNINYIQIPKSEAKEIKKEEINPIKMNLEYRPTSKIKEIVIEDKVFYGLSTFELYYIEIFLNDAAIKEKTYQKEIKITRDIVKIRADIKYTEEKQYSNLGKNTAKFFGCLTIVGIPFVIAYSGNKIRKKANKAYKKELKNRGYNYIKQDLKSANPKIIEF
ncbi:hypothetical protein [Spiroplasma endosymbiont of Atherix ibis]|uniref:hypothetical protein n=1 Tax=Spiroplasma endosymbiont of Atherix ibis TaxID=3066291 RepID=UPI0030CF090E